MSDLRDRFGPEEEAALIEALRDNKLWPYSSGGYAPFMDKAVKMVQAHFTTRDQRAYMIPTASGTSSIQVALGGLQIPQGSEVIVTPITDPGSVTPIIFHNAIPVFADVDSESGLVTPDTIAKVLTHRTSAIIAVHLTGSPVDIPGIRKMLEDEKRTDVKIIEDVAQGLGASLDGVPLGMLGDAGCFSLNSHKHISVGEGGFVLVHEEELFVRTHNYSDKHRDRFGYGAAIKKENEHKIYRGPGHSLRMGELRGAMLVAQMPKLKTFAAASTAFGKAVDARLIKTSDLVPQTHLKGAVPSYFGLMFKANRPASVEEKGEVNEEVKKRLSHLGARLFGSYTSSNTPIYKYALFQNRNFGPATDGVWPGELIAGHYHKEVKCGFYDYKTVSCPEAEKYLERAFWLNVHEGYTPEHAIEIADTIVDVFVDHKLCTRT